MTARKCASTRSIAVKPGNNFSVSDTIIPEEIYTIHSNCSAYVNFKSFGVIWLRKDVFVPSNSNPVFYFAENSYNESYTCRVAISNCYEDIDFIHSTTELSAYWTLSSNVLNHVTSFKVGLLDITNNELVTPETNVGKFTNFTFTSLDLLKGVHVQCISKTLFY